MKPQLNMVGLDFETYASTDLLKHGLHRYINCPDFQPLLAAVASHQGNVTQYYMVELFDFVGDYADAKGHLIETLGDNLIVAHNAGFEQSVLKRMGINIPSSRFIDSAVLARAAGAAGKLEAAAPQLLGSDKLETGYNLIKLFSIPGKYQEEAGDGVFDPKIRIDYADEWVKFAEYCAVDAELSLRLAETLMPSTSADEMANNAVTMDMNNTGWHVDLAVVRRMQDLYLENIAKTVDNFRIDTGAMDLNLSSYPQLVAWCAERGVKVSSFDEAHVEKLLRLVEKKLGTSTLTQDKRDMYTEVKHLLNTKQVLGGSSLKKLQTILDTVGTDGRLHDQYLHCGAGATFRTSGRGVQMQNLKRLNGEGDDMTELTDSTVMWSNGRLASNLRQVFTATDPRGQLIVGDFSSVESRGLAWQAGEEWKLEAYRDGRPVYEEQAALMFNKPVSQVTKPERQLGKAGELSCGYQAGPEAVRDFAAKMGLVLSEGESVKLVKDWRANNPKTVEYWYALDAALHGALTFNSSKIVNLPHGQVILVPGPAPQSLRDQVKDQTLRSLRIRLYLNDPTLVLERVIHGTHIEGTQVMYWKPSELKSGDLWKNFRVNPKTQAKDRLNLYGGKLAGLLTQSLCREMFFASLRGIHAWAQHHTNVQLVGQFHDEIVLDWKPGSVSLQQTRAALAAAMTTTTLPGFPLAADIKADYRYTK